MNILLGVCGSISAYKSLDLARIFVNRGHRVRVILTRGASEFVHPQVFRYLGCENVHHAKDDFNFPDADADKGVLHINLARWADQLIMAPLSANTLSLLAQGRCQDLLTSVFLSLEPHIPVLLFPAMNTQMLEHPFTQENKDHVLKLKSLNQVYCHPSSVGELACGEQGLGKLPSVEEILMLSQSFPSAQSVKAKKVQEKNILITTGATISPLDPIRFLTNSSSGETGLQLAVSFLARGCRVHVIAGKNATSDLNLLEHHPRFQLSRVVTTKDMAQCVQSHLADSDVYISAAAISDIEFDVHNQKMKKEFLEQSLPIKKAADILNGVLVDRPSHLKVVGFAAETELSEESLLDKWQRKPVDLLVGNCVHNGYVDQHHVQGFGQKQGEYTFIEKGKKTDTKTLRKDQLANYIFDNLFHDHP